MLDCPPHIHTSPKSIFSITNSSPSLKVIDCGPLASFVATLTFQLPSQSDLTLYSIWFQDVFIATFLFGVAYPQRFTSEFRWSTILFPIIPGSLTSALSIKVIMLINIKKDIRLILFDIYILTVILNKRILLI